MKLPAVVILSAIVSVLFAAPVIREKNGTVSMDNGILRSRLVKGRNYAFNVSSKLPDGKNQPLVIQSMIWYHGRSGNTNHFYQDQSELNWKPVKTEIGESVFRVHTGNTDYDVVRETSMFPDCDAVKLEYRMTVRESRDFSQDNFPLLYLTPEIKNVSFDTGGGKTFRTAENPSKEDLNRSSILFFHLPKAGKTLLLLADLNLPLKYGQKLGSVLSCGKTNWCRTFKLCHLWQESMPYYEKGMKTGAVLYFQLLDGGSLNDRQVEDARKLAERFGVKPPQFTPSVLDHEYKYPSALAGLVNKDSALTLWQETTMKRVYPNTVTPKKNTPVLRLEAAANERESLQLVLNPENDLMLEKVEFSGFTSASGGKIGKNSFRASVLEYQQVNNLRALFYGEKRFADKMCPLPENLPVKLPKKLNTILHLTFFIPPKTPADIYRGEVRLSAGGKTIGVPAELKVWGVELPLRSAYHAHGLLWNSPQTTRSEVLKYLAECGMSASVYYGGQKEFRRYFDGSELRLPDCFQLAEKALKEYHMPLFQVPYMFLGAWNWKPGKKVYFLNLQLDSSEFDRKFPAALKSIHRQLAEKDMVDRSFIYLWDEMTGGHYEAMRKTTGMVRKYAPGLRILTVAAPDPEVLAHNDIICVGPLSHWWSPAAEAVVRKALKEGREFWIYLNGTTFATHVEAITPRMTPWLCHARGFSGFLQWSMDYNWAKGTFAANGKTWMLYPAKDKPVYSVRLEYFRDGIEDFNMMELMKQLPDKVRTELEKEIRAVAPAFGPTLQDPVRLTLIRRKIGSALEKHLKSK